MISFKGAQFPKEVILFAVFFYVRYTVSYRDLEEIMAERGVLVDHATLNRWVARCRVALKSETRGSGQNMGVTQRVCCLGRSGDRRGQRLW
jgi:putative transposase